ncbi:MAG: ribosome assembly cofactor RimP [Bacteroidota bacterium]|jgi:ribosome maturation factor RimP
MISAERVKQIVQEKISETELFLVEVKVSTDNKIYVALDSMNGVTISECVLVNRHIENSIDREQEDYELEVSSAGLSASFKVANQYIKNKGKTLAVLTNQGERYEGIILAADETGFSLETNKGSSSTDKKKIVSLKQEMYFTYLQVKSAKLVITF